jgi:hypothetical protein
VGPPVVPPRAAAAAAGGRRRRRQLEARVHGGRRKVHAGGRQAAR